MLNDNTTFCCFAYILLRMRRNCNLRDSWHMLNALCMDLEISFLTLISAPQIRRASRWHCALYKFIYLLTYFITSSQLLIDFHFFSKILSMACLALNMQEADRYRFHNIWAFRFTTLRTYYSKADVWWDLHVMITFLQIYLLVRWWNNDESPPNFMQLGRNFRLVAYFSGSGSPWITVQGALIKQFTKNKRYR